MQIVECPHCATRVSNDGSLSERAVTCPVCAQQFHMPAYTAPAPSGSPPCSEAGESDVAEDADDSGGFRPRRKQGRKSAWFWLTILGSTAMFWLVVLVVLLATDFRWLRRGPEKGGKVKHVEPARKNPGK